MSQQPDAPERYVLEVDVPAGVGPEGRRRLAERLRRCADDLGADLPGVVSRVDVVRSGFAGLRRVPPIVLGDDLRTVLVGDRAVTLAHKEFLILRLLVSRPGEVVTRQEIVEALRARGVRPAQRTVDVHVHRIRAKLGRGGECVATVRGEGYRYREPVRAVAVG